MVEMGALRWPTRVAFACRTDGAVEQQVQILIRAVLRQAATAFPVQTAFAVGTSILRCINWAEKQYRVITLDFGFY